MTISIPAKDLGDFKVCLMRDSDAQAVVDLYRTVYGDPFPIQEMYDPQCIVQQQEAGLMHRVLVVDAA